MHHNFCFMVSCFFFYGFDIYYFLKLRVTADEPSEAATLRGRAFINVNFFSCHRFFILFYFYSTYQMKWFTYQIGVFLNVFKAVSRDEDCARDKVAVDRQNKSISAGMCSLWLTANSKVNTNSLYKKEGFILFWKGSSIFPRFCPLIKYEHIKLNWNWCPFERGHWKPLTAPNKWISFYPNVTWLGVNRALKSIICREIKTPLYCATRDRWLANQISDHIYLQKLLYSLVLRLSWSEPSQSWEGQQMLHSCRVQGQTPVP